MKVVMLAWSIEDYALEFSQAVASQCAVTLCVPRAWMPRDGVIKVPGVEVVPLEWPRHRSLRNVRLLRQLRRILDEQAPDVVHCLNVDAVWLNLLFPLRRAYTWVSTVHDVTYHPGDTPSQQVPPVFKRCFIHRSDAIMVHGESLRDQAVQKFHLTPQRVGVVSHVGLFRYRQLADALALRPQSDGCLNVLFFGRIYAYKGLQYFMESEPLVRKALPQVRFVIAGQGEPFDKYRRFMQEGSTFDIRNRRIPDAEVGQLFLDADIIVLPYIEASQSGVIPIAVTFGKPVIVTAVGELPHLVNQGGGIGLVVPPENSGALAEAVIRLGRDEALRRRCGLAALTMADTVLSHESVGKQAVHLYERWRSTKVDCE
jgi:glycosyltransferase involved in cell wall biosynthesis